MYYKEKSPKKSLRKSLRMVDIDLQMVKLSDDSPWLIEDLKKLEVVDSYE